MSEKVIDPATLLAQVQPEASARDRRLFEMRLAEEHDAEAVEQRAKDVNIGPPPIPDAQLVYNATTHTTGVAIRGARRICPLPKGYGGPGCELAMIHDNVLIVIQPGKSPLSIDPDTGTTRRL